MKIPIIVTVLAINSLLNSQSSALGQKPPECYMVNSSGQRLDLSNLCSDAYSQPEPTSTPNTPDCTATNAQTGQATGTNCNITNSQNTQTGQATATDCSATNTQNTQNTQQPQQPQPIIEKYKIPAGASTSIRN